MRPYAVPVLVAVFLLSACAKTSQTVHVAPDAFAGQTRYAAVLPLVNLTTQAQAGRAVGDILATELYGLSGFTFMERTAMAQLLRTGEQDLEYLMDTAVARQVGRQLGVDTVIYGSVTEYGYKRGLDQSPAVGLSVRMLDVNSGRVIWTAAISESGCRSGCSLSYATQKACKQLVDELADRSGLTVNR